VSRDVADETRIAGRGGFGLVSVMGGVTPQSTFKFPMGGVRLPFKSLAHFPAILSDWIAIKQAPFPTRATPSQRAVDAPFPIPRVKILR
jgi:hypothetical protein